jgi:hypothetical protein
MQKKLHIRVRQTGISQRKLIKEKFFFLARLLANIFQKDLSENFWKNFNS